MRAFLTFALSVAAMGVALAPPVLADDPQWPRLRGPNGAGLADAAGIPVQWTEADYRWKVTLPGGGHSSPVVWGDRVFVTCADEKTARRTLVCLKAADGSTLWTRDFEAKPCDVNSLNSLATPTPAADSERVYVCWATPEDFPVIALDHAGREVWRRDLGPFKSQHGHGASPIVLGDMLIVTDDQDGKSFVIALDAKDGKTRWQTDRPSAKAAYSTPCVYQGEGVRPQIILTNTATGITSIDSATGKVNWESPSVFPERVVSSPFIAAGLVLGSCGTGGVAKHLVAVRPPSKDGDKPEVAWKIAKDAPYVPTGLARGDLVFLWSEGGVVQCVRAATGQQVWRQRIKGTFYASPVCVGERLYAISSTGEVVVLAAGAEFKELARNPLGEKSHATPAVAGGRMFLRTWSHVVCAGG